MAIKVNKAPRLVGWRYAAFIGGFIGLIGLTLYPIAISPMLHPEKYREIQKKSRKGINQEEIQPGNMKIWSNPFEKKKESKE